MIAPIIAALVVQLADVATTTMVLNAGGREANPVMRWVMARFGRAWWVVKLAVVMALVVWLASVGLAVLAWIGVVGTAVIVARNLVVLGRME